MKQTVTKIRIIAEHYTDDGFLIDFSQEKTTPDFLLSALSALDVAFPSDAERSEAQRLRTFLGGKQ